MRPRGMLLAFALAVGSTLGVLPVAAPATALAQETPSTGAQPPAVVVPAVTTAPVPQTAPVFAREQAPRTLRAHWHVFAAFAIAWLLLFGYTVALGRRFARIERSLDAVRGGATA